MAEYKTSLYPHQPIICSNKVSLNTSLNSNTVEWCPIDSQSNLLLCGTYSLDTGFNRYGNLELYGWVTNGSFALLNRHDEGAGVLDLKWLPLSFFGNIFYVVNSIGQLNVYSIDCALFEIKKIQCLQVCDKSDGSELCLSFDWVSNEDRSIILSDSVGRLAFMDCCDTGELVCKSQWKAHDYEVWITSRDNWNKDVVFSGGDDNKLRGWDLRLAGSASGCVFTSSRHVTGVCAIQSHPLREHLLATGSFDETLLIWDTRDMSKPLNRVQIEDGGIWRLKWHHSDPNLLLAACTRAGAAVFDFTVSLSMPSVTWYREHQSLVYGVDWRRGEYKSESNSDVDQMLNQFGDMSMDTAATHGGNAIQYSSDVVNYQIASCSFYDRSLHIWSIDRYRI
ncbi:Diphthamide biosynthesis protein 7 isoform X1 [Oopsacas minuta]|uniref:methylated diphthine methylhydrolase n=1 Tax=Oopsacas minuta TaxID=111878 RepID=A0AAV7JYQ2_9METZ|nr:Diphthamide biosynthesis protein 7 isoform X1 [Oopsacas minuta]